MNADQPNELKCQLVATKDGNFTQDSAKLLARSSDEAPMSLAVHEPSNSIVVTALKPLFEEVEKLVRQLDAEGAQAVGGLWYWGATQPCSTVRSTI